MDLGKVPDGMLLHMVLYEGENLFICWKEVAAFIMLLPVYRAMERRDKETHVGEETGIWAKLPG